MKFSRRSLLKDLAVVPAISLATEQRPAADLVRIKSGDLIATFDRRDGSKMRNCSTR